MPCRRLEEVRVQRDDHRDDVEHGPERGLERAGQREQGTSST
jgi:hypothetical protein